MIQNAEWLGNLGNELGEKKEVVLWKHNTEDGADGSSYPCPVIASWIAVVDFKAISSRTLPSKVAALIIPTRMTQNCADYEFWKL